MGLFFRKKPTVASDLRAVTRGLHEAATSANHMVSQQYIRLFDQFFDYDRQALGTPMKARMVEVALDAGHSMQVPLISLVAPRGLSLDTMRVDLSVKIDSTQLEEASDALENGELDSERFFVTFGSPLRHEPGRHPDEVQISLTFKACEPPEGIQRLIDEYTRLIAPRPTADPGEG
ncbi:DUF2589 domain-containing protein [Pseudomonas typographi]|uniref:DUF2589 domain-containing protein n=1 Tax=Pseudomonas typographi TaxID=2715964 RepID=UPI00168772A1|nr:DUF2589 domain-containing protein [Pseudomonas typographi]